MCADEATGQWVSERVGVGVRFDSGTGGTRGRAGGGKKDDARTTAEVYINKLRFRWAYSSRAETTRAR